MSEGMRPPVPPRARGWDHLWMVTTARPVRSATLRAPPHLATTLRATGDTLDWFIIADYLFSIMKGQGPRGGLYPFPILHSFVFRHMQQVWTWNGSEITWNFAALRSTKLP
jgi:hypothetical protein